MILNNYENVMIVFYYITLLQFVFILYMVYIMHKNRSMLSVNQMFIIFIFGFHMKCIMFVSVSPC